MTVQTRRTIATLLLALTSALMGALVNGYLYGLSTGERLAIIDVRLHSVEVSLQRITCLQVVGTVTCQPFDHSRGGS